MLDGMLAMIAQWNHWYANSTATSTTVTFAHVGGLLLGGGSAVAADLATLRVARASARQRLNHVIELGRVHRTVLAGLAVVLVSGALMAAADVETFLGSRVFWLKMALVLALIGNGFRLVRAERRLRHAPLGDTGGWNRLRSAAATSLGLWFVLLLLGTALRAV